MEVNMVADMEVDKVADMEVAKMADMVVDMDDDNLADMVLDMEVEKVAEMVVISVKDDACPTGPKPAHRATRRAHTFLVDHNYRVGSDG